MNQAESNMNSENIKADTNTDKPLTGMHVVAKPIGPVCNLACEYCFYLEKKAMFDAGENFRMSDKTLAAFITNYVTTQPTPLVEFVWQGGEPTLMGLDFFSRVIKHQKPFLGQKTITNSLQTNGTLLTDEWCDFLKKNNFMVGISLDGPRDIHNTCRRDRAGHPMFDSVLRGLKLLQNHGVEYNILACVARETARHPLKVYSFLKGEGVEYIQFTPVIERRPDALSIQNGLRFAAPVLPHREEQATEVTPLTVVPEDYADFLIAIYEDWVRHDVGSVFVMNFEWALNAWIGNPAAGKRAPCFQGDGSHRCPSDHQDGGLGFPASTWGLSNGAAGRFYTGRLLCVGSL